MKLLITTHSIGSREDVSSRSIFLYCPPSLTPLTEADRILLREANRTKMEHFIYVFLGTIHKSQEVWNTGVYYRAPAPGSVKSVLHAEILMPPKLSAGDDTNQMDAIFVSVCVIRAIEEDISRIQAQLPPTTTR